MEYVTAKEIEKLNFRIGKIKAVKEHPDAPYYILAIDLGQTDHDLPVVVDLKEAYKLTELIGKQVIYLENFETRKIKGEDSVGAIMIATIDGKPKIISPDQEFPTGVKVSEITDTWVTYHPKE